jgi:hypothetical protein
MAERGLAIVRCGRGSLHPAWREGAAAAEWDLQLCPYEEGDADWPPARPGQKWEGLHAHLLADPRWRDYDYIWLPDDDLATDAATVAALFAQCRRFGAALAAPALTEDSHWSLAITLRNHAFAARAVSYVEVMAPCFRREVLEQLLPTFRLSYQGAGWGLDHLWSQRLEWRGLYIFDELAVCHTRATLLERDPAQARRLDRGLWRLLARHRVRPLVRTLRGYAADGRAQEADEGPFLLRYLQGYDWLIASHPWVLRRLVEEQTHRPHIVRHWRRLLYRLRDWRAARRTARRAARRA